METFDVAIIGGGLIGCSIALDLANENLKTVVIEKREPGREASWAAAGMLSPPPDSARDIPLVPLSRESLRIYPEFVRAVEDEFNKTWANETMARPRAPQVRAAADGASARIKTACAFAGAPG